MSSVSGNKPEQPNIVSSGMYLGALLANHVLSRCMSLSDFSAGQVTGFGAQVQHFLLEFHGKEAIL